MLCCIFIFATNTVGQERFTVSSLSPELSLYDAYFTKGAELFSGSYKSRNDDCRITISEGKINSVTVYHPDSYLKAMVVKRVNGHYETSFYNLKGEMMQFATFATSPESIPVLSSYRIAMNSLKKEQLITIDMVEIYKRGREMYVQYNGEPFTGCISNQYDQFCIRSLNGIVQETIVYYPNKTKGVSITQNSRGDEIKRFYDVDGNEWAVEDHMADDDYKQATSYLRTIVTNCILPYVIRENK